MWYYKEKGKNKVEAVPFEYTIMNSTRFYDPVTGKAYSHTAVNTQNISNTGKTK
jgi:hypothetical protein